MTVVIADLTVHLRTAAEWIDTHGWTQGTEQDSRGRVCLTGAVRLCSPQPGDWGIVREVLRHQDRAEAWNDGAGRTAAEVVGYLRTAEVTDADLAGTFGPQWEPIVTHIRRAATLTSDEAIRLAATLDATWAATWDATRDATLAATWDATRDATLAATWAATLAATLAATRAATLDATWAAARALSLRDLIGGTFTAEHYRLLTGPWAAVIGPVHPDDERDGLYAGTTSVLS